MSWNRKVVIRILLLVAKMIEEDSSIKTEIVVLSQHIDVWAFKSNEHSSS